MNVESLVFDSLENVKHHIRKSVEMFWRGISNNLEAPLVIKRDCTI